MLDLAPFRGTADSPQFLLWLEQLYIQLQVSDVKKGTVVPTAATDPATTQTLVNEIRAALIDNGILK